MINASLTNALSSGWLVDYAICGDSVECPTVQGTLQYVPLFLACNDRNYLFWTRWGERQVFERIGLGTAGPSTICRRMLIPPTRKGQKVVHPETNNDCGLLIKI